MKHPLLAALGGLLFAAASVTAAPQRIDRLTLERALEIAERRHPQLAEARALVDAAGGRARQAGALPNPEAILGAQQIPARDYPVPDRQYLAGFGQTIPLGDRLGRAREVELLEREVRLRGLESVRRRIRQRVQGRFATALHQESAHDAQARIVSATSLSLSVVKARLDAGDAIPQDVAQAEIALALAEVDLRRIETLRKQGLTTLSTEIGEPELEVVSVEGTLDAAFEIPTLESLATGISALPEIRAAEAAAQAGRMRVELAEAERIPDVKLEALYHRLEISGQNTVDFGLSFPLPLLNRNQGRIQEARADAAAAAARARDLANGMNLDLRTSHLSLTRALEALKTHRTRILPRAETVLRAAELRHSAGDSALTEVLDARRHWAAVHLAYLEVLREAMQSWAEVSTFVGPKGR